MRISPFLQDPGPSLPASVVFVPPKQLITQFEDKPCLQPPAWPNRAATASGIPSGLPPKAPRLFGVTLTRPPEDNPSKPLPLRTGSLPVDSSGNSKRRFGEAFECAPMSEGTARQLVTVRRVLSEGQAGWGSLLGAGGVEPRQQDERRLWGESLRDGFLEKGLDSQGGPEGPKVKVPKLEELVQTSGGGDGGGGGPALGLGIGPPEAEDEGRSQVKCFVEESPYGVVVDLSHYKSTQHLKNALLDATNGRLIVYQDKDGDMILLGDEDWLFFLKNVRRIFIRK